MPTTTRLALWPLCEADTAEGNAVFRMLAEIAVITEFFEIERDTGSRRARGP